MTYSLTLNKYVFGTYQVPLWMPGKEQLRMADNRVIIATLLALCHSTQKTGKIIIQIHLQYKLLCCSYHLSIKVLREGENGYGLEWCWGRLCSSWTVKLMNIIKDLAFKIYSLSNFQIYTTALTTIIRLYVAYQCAERRLYNVNYKSFYSSVVFEFLKSFAFCRIHIKTATFMAKDKIMCISLRPVWSPLTITFLMKITAKLFINKYFSECKNVTKKKIILWQGCE